MIGSSLDPAHYRDARFVAERLHRMTAGRRRIALPADQVDTVATALRECQPTIAEAAPSVVAEIKQAIPIPRPLG
jgi:hypothetical protein